VTIDKQVANAVVNSTWQIKWSPFDIASGLEYTESWKLIGDDTGQDGDNAQAGDDPVNTGLNFLATLSANGQATTDRSKSKTIAFANLDEDGVGLDDEIRAVVTLTPLLPTAKTKESPAVVVDADA
jgi:hypothetical protein